MDKNKLLETIHEILSASYKDASTKLTVAMTAILESNPAYYWVGLYILRGEILHLGPFSGPPTEHTTIPVGRGVCGTAVATGQDQNIPDVRQLDNYLACNIYTKSELVTLIRNPQGEIIGQIDIDASVIEAFSMEDVKFFHELGVLLAPFLDEI